MAWTMHFSRLINHKGVMLMLEERRDSLAVVAGSFFFLMSALVLFGCDGNNDFSGTAAGLEEAIPYQGEEFSENEDAEEGIGYEDGLLWPGTFQPLGPSYGNQPVGASTIYQGEFYLSQRTEIFTAQLSLGGDTVIHLLKDGQEVSRNDDDGSSRASRVVFTPSSPGWYQLIVRAYDPYSSGTCDIYLQAGESPPVPMHFGAFFGGYRVDLKVANADTIELVPMNSAVQEVKDTVIYGFSATPGETMVFDDDSGVGHSAKLWVPEFGSIDYVVIGTYQPSQDMRGDLLRLFVNDPMTDQDGDGLGSAAEEALCTCDHDGQTTCLPGKGRKCELGKSGLFDTRDTDGDGIRDDYETVGMVPSAGDNSSSVQLLPMWGANPLHKDLFVEVDYMTAAGSPMTPAVATEIAKIYNESGTAQYLKNPDGTDGVRVHLDIGVADPTGGTVYGNWGGVTMVADDHSYPKADRFQDIRKGVFHYVPMDAGGGHQAPMCSWKFACDNNAATCAHELGHNLCISHGGSTWAGEQNGKPNYISLMNYSFSSHKSFSKGQRPVLNPESLCEEAGLNTNDYALIDYLDLAVPQDNCFNYSAWPNAAGTWGIDWNRDGVISPCSSPVRAAPNYSMGHCSPELGRFYAYRSSFRNKANNAIAVNPADDMTPSIGRAFGRTYLAEVEANGDLVLLSSSHPDFKVACDTSKLSGCAPWKKNLVGGARLVGPSLASFSVYGTELLVVVYAKLNSKKWEYKILDKNHSWVAVGELGTEPYGEPSIVNWGSTVMVTWLEKGTSTPVSSTLSASTLQFSEPAIQQADSWGNGVAAVSAVVNHPGGVRAIFATKNGTGPLVYRWSEYQGNDTWKTVQANMLGTDGWLVPKSQPHRIGLAYIQDAAIVGGGRWYLLYKDFNQLVRMNMTRGYGLGNEVWDNDTRYDNGWYKTNGSGLALYGYRPGQPEKSLRLSLIFNHKKNHLDFRPFADGIVDVALKDNNDFAVMGRGLCASLHGCTSPLCTHGAGDNACVYK